MPPARRQRLPTPARKAHRRTYYSKPVRQPLGWDLSNLNATRIVSEAPPHAGSWIGAAAVLALSVLTLLGGHDYASWNGLYWRFQAANPAFVTAAWTGVAGVLWSLGLWIGADPLDSIPMYATEQLRLSVVLRLAGSALAAAWWIAATALLVLGGTYTAAILTVGAAARDGAYTTRLFLACSGSSAGG